MGGRGDCRALGGHSSHEAWSRHGAVRPGGERPCSRCRRRAKRHDYQPRSRRTRPGADVGRPGAFLRGRTVRDHASRAGNHVGDGASGVRAAPVGPGGHPRRARLCRLRDPSVGPRVPRVRRVRRVPRVRRVRHLPGARRVPRVPEVAGFGGITAKQLNRNRAEHHELARFAHDPVAAPNQPRPRHMRRPVPCERVNRPALLTFPAPLECQLRRNVTNEGCLPSRIHRALTEG